MLRKPYWWKGLIQSEVERISGPRSIRVHRYRGGPPSRRLRRMQIALEVRARRAGVAWDIVDLREVYKRHSGICGICTEAVSFEVFEIDHIRPIVRGGPHVLENLQPAHRACNTMKHDKESGWLISR